MDDSRVLESLDSLWFFTNIFSPRKQSSSPASDEIAVESHVRDPPKEELSEPSSTILQNQTNELPCGENSVPMCPKCGEVAAEIEDKAVKPAETELLEFQRSTETKERRTKRRSKRSLNQKRKIPGELDSSHFVMEVSGSWMFAETCGYQRFGGQNGSIMPSLNDNVAMKQHLKSWAYAVACTVR